MSVSRILRYNVNKLAEHLHRLLGLHCMCSTLALIYVLDSIIIAFYWYNFNCLWLQFNKYLQVASRQLDKSLRVKEEKVIVGWPHKSVRLVDRSNLLNELWSLQDRLTT